MMDPKHQTPMKFTSRYQEEPCHDVVLGNFARSKFQLQATCCGFGVHGDKLQHHVDHEDQVNTPSDEEQSIPTNFQQANLERSDQCHKSQGKVGNDLPRVGKTVAVWIDDPPWLLHLKAKAKKIELIPYNLHIDNVMPNYLFYSDQ